MFYTPFSGRRRLDHLRDLVLGLERRPFRASERSVFHNGSIRFKYGRLWPHLEQRGIRFAPTELAAQFSVENRPYASSFGYHGRVTERLSGFSIESIALEVVDAGETFHPTDTTFVSHV